MAEESSLPDLKNLKLPERDVLQAFALGWSPRPIRWIQDLLLYLHRFQANSKPYTDGVIRSTINDLVALKLLVPMPGHPAVWGAALAARATAYSQALEQEPPDTLRRALWATTSFSEKRPQYRKDFPSEETLAAVMRLELHRGATLADMERFSALCLDTSYHRLLWLAALDGLHPSLFSHLREDVQKLLISNHLGELDRDWQSAYLPLVDIAKSRLNLPGGEGLSFTRLLLAEHQLLAGRDAEAGRFLAEINLELHPAMAPYVEAINAARACTRGEWESAQAGFESAFTKLKKATGERQSLLPDSIAWLYPLSLMAQHAPAQHRAALKFCQGEAGEKNPEADALWGILVNGIQMRLGDKPVNLRLFEPRSHGQVDRGDLWRWLMRAWLGDGASAKPLSAPAGQSVQLILDRLEQCDLYWTASQLRAAVATCTGQPVLGPFFCFSSQDKWRSTLLSLEALLAEAEADLQAATRLIWRVEVNAKGAVIAIDALEQKHGPRGWNKAKEMSLKRLFNEEALPAHDLRVARCVRAEPTDARHYCIDRAAAILALVGHPAVEFLGAEGVFVELTDAQPSIVVEEAEGKLRLRVVPDPAGMDPNNVYISPYMTATEVREQEALRAITVVRDAPDRARVIRFNATQRRAAQLLGHNLVLPKDARDALHRSLEALANTFDVQIDSTLVSRQVPAETRLRAELSRSGEGVALRLVAAPLGADGPRCIPGSGRQQVIATWEGETVGAQRDLAGEQAQLATILDACLVLDDAGLSSGWVLEDPEQALELVEALPTLAAVAGIDWPRGKPITLTRAAAGALHVRIRSAAEWFELQGGIHVDESLVVDLQRLLQWGGQRRGRFVPLADGKYLALTKELAARLTDMATVAEKHKDGSRVPQLAASWLNDTLEGARVEVDAAFGKRLRQLAQSWETTPVVPPGLLAQLRPYQLDGFVWAMRLAQAGFGAILADDMGLGKTIQALAVMLARATGGPCLVVAPTSVCGNWSAEALKFAPALIVRQYGEDEGAGRERLLSQAGPYDVVVVSYAMMQRSAEEFAKYHWHTLVVDEGQAIKNAAAIRTKAVFDLKGGFRIALSGTPIENHLSELWSIMRFCNPGLLGTQARFNERFATPIERNHDRDAQRTLRRLIAPFILRRLKTEVLEELPPLTEKIITVKLDATEAAHYEALRRVAASAAESQLETGAAGQAHLHVLAQLTRLRRAACDPRLVSDEFALVGAKVRAFAELAQELTDNKHRVLVFSQFVDFLALLREPLDAAGIRYQYLDGSTPTAERTRRVAAFQAGEGEMFLISLKAGGFGLNLTAADYVVITDPWYNPQSEAQAMGRAHRMGQEKPVTAYRLVTEGTIEESIIELHRDKRALAEGVLDGGEGAAIPSTEDLMALIRG